MMNDKIFLGLLMVCACVCTVPPIRQCQQYECAEFSVVQNTEAYQLRQYAASKWVSSRGIIINHNWKQVKKTLFNNLFAYIRGANIGGVEINMTAPVLTKVEPVTAANPQFVMTMYFHIPASFQLNTPAPTNPDVSVVSIPDRQVYVRSFSGIAGKKNSMLNLAQLKTAIGNDALYDNSYVISASYDRPRTRQHRHNELWLVKN